MSGAGYEMDGFLSRWSRRKQAAEKPEPVETEAEREVDSEAAPPSSGEPSETDEELLARLELPDPDTLGKGDDFAVYLRVPLPDHLRRRALRRLWRSNPVLANLDGLNDYDDDFTGDSVPLGTLRTAYKVGRGLLAPAAEDDVLDEVLPQADHPATEADPVPKTAGVLAADVPSGEDEPGALQDAPDAEDAAPAPTRRRMAFRFSDGS